MKLTFDEHLSPHFTVGEFFRSGTAIRLGIENEPDAHPEDGLTNEEVVENLRALCTEVLEPLRRRVGRVIITSGYRCQKLNKAVGRWVECGTRSTSGARLPTYMCRTRRWRCATDAFSRNILPCSRCCWNRLGRSANGGCT